MIMIQYIMSTYNLCLKENYQMGNEQIERWYSMKEISEYLGITRDTALSWIEKRGMPGVKVGRTWKFKISEVDAWMRSGEKNNNE